MMKIAINDKQRLLGLEAKDELKQRVARALNKFDRTVKSVHINVQDVNGPRGGSDKECRMLVRLRKQKDVAVSVRDGSLFRAVTDATSIATRSVRKAVDRKSVRRSVGRANLGFET